MSILVGTNDLQSGGDEYDVEKYMAHEKHDNPLYANDIAVIKIKGSIEFNKKVQPIKLLSEEVPDGALLQLTGWGSVQSGASPRKLQIINLNAVATKRCRQIFESQNIEVHDSHICTFTKVGEGACYVCDLIFIKHANFNEIYAFL